MITGAIRLQDDNENVYKIVQNEPAARAGNRHEHHAVYGSCERGDTVNPPKFENHKNDVRIEMYTHFPDASSAFVHIGGTGLPCGLPCTGDLRDTKNTFNENIKTNLL